MAKGSRKGAKKGTSDDDHQTAAAGNTRKPNNNNNRKAAATTTTATATTTPKNEGPDDVGGGPNGGATVTGGSSGGCTQDSVVAGDSMDQPSKKLPQATSDQLMIASLTDSSWLEDPIQRMKIKRVMDITFREEDAVAMALYETEWDEDKAVLFLLDGSSSHLGPWEKTGKKKKKNKTTPSAEEQSKDEWEESEISLVSTQSSETKSRGQQQRGGGPPRLRRSCGTGTGRKDGGKPEDFGERVRGPSARRGGRGGGSMRNYASRNGQITPISGSSGIASSGGFSGSIDTWNPPGSTLNHSDPARPDPQIRRSGRHNNKDAFDNAGNWGDDFPTAEDWDNEEYTGSLADTKVFTAKNQKVPEAVKAGAAVGSNRQSTLPPSTTAPQLSTTYSQSIDLSTLLQKPTTQSSLTTPQSLLQFQSQTETVVGMNSSSSSTSSVSKTSNGEMYNNYGTAAVTSGQSAVTVVTGGATTGNKSSRLPPPSKIPASAVEMPGDSLSKLDVQFGGLDLQFGNSADNGFEFNGSSPPVSNASLGDNSKYASSAPSAKEVNKSLASISSSKLNEFTKATQQVPSVSNSYVKNSAEMYNNNPYYSYTNKPYSSSYNNSQYSNQSVNYNGQSYSSSPSVSYANYSSASGYSNKSVPSTTTTTAGASATYDGSSLKYENSGTSSNVTTSIHPSPTSGSGAASLGLTNTTNALSGKVSATAASKVVPNLPPGVANMIPHQYMLGNAAAAGLPTAFIGLQQPMYSAYNNAPSMEGLAALQRGAAAAASLHSLAGAAGTAPPVTAPYYGHSFAAANSSGRSGESGTDSHNSFNDKNFGSTNNSDSTSSPIPSTISTAAAQAALSVAAAASQPFDFNTLAAQQQAAAAASLPPGYAYFYSQVPTLQAAYGATPGVYAPGAMNVVPTAAGGTATTQFQKNAYGSSYGSGYDNLSNHGSKDFGSSYSSESGNGKAVAASAVANAGSSSSVSGTHQFWGDIPTIKSRLW